MIKILLVFNNGGLNPEFVNSLKQSENVDVEISENGSIALNIAGVRDIDLAVVAETLSDMTGIKLVEKLVMINPMINTAIVSDLSKEAFHDATEGLGVLMAISLDAGKVEAFNLLEYFYKINNVAS